MLTEATILYNQIRHFQRRNRAVSRFGSSFISLIQLHLLIEISTNSSIYPSKLADLLMIPRQECSRLCKGLLNSSTIKFGSSTNSRKPLELTAKGKELLQSVDKIADLRLKQLFKDVKPISLKHIASLMRVVADEWNVPALIHRKIEHPIRHELRRITRAFGLIGSTTFGYPINATEWHVLTALHNDEQVDSIRKMSHEFELLENSLRLILRRLESKKLIVQIPSPNGRRSGKFELTSSGETLIKSIEEHASKRIAKALNYMNKSEISDALKSLKLVTGWPRDALRIETKKLSARDELLSARRLFLKTVYSSIENAEIPSELYSSKTSAYGLFKGEVLLACASLIEKKAKLACIGFDPAQVTPKMLREFLAKTINSNSDSLTSQHLFNGDPALIYGWGNK